MSSKTFVDFQPPVIDADWLNDANTAVYNTIPTLTPLIPFPGELASTGNMAQGVALVGGAGRVVTSIAALRALPKTGSPQAFVTGYNTQGDGGGGRYWYNAADTTSSDNGGTIIVAADGGRWYLADPGRMAIGQFGVIGNGATNNNSAMAALVAVGGDFYAAPGTYLLTAATTFGIPANIEGSAAGSIFNAGVAMPANTNLFHVSPTTGAYKAGWKFRDFQVTVASGSGIQDVFNLNVTNAGQYLSNMDIGHIIAAPVAGWFVNIVNPTNADGVFTSRFHDNLSSNGYNLNLAGDSITCENNTVTGTGPNPAFYVNQVIGAANITIRDNNITATGGSLVASVSENLLFENNQCECPSAFTGNVSVMVYFNNTTPASSINPRIRGNNINTHGFVADCIFLKGTLNAVVEDNILACAPATENHIVIDASAQNTYIGPNTYIDSASGVVVPPVIADSGVGTMGIWKPATLATWTTLVDPANGFPVGFFKTRDGMVLLRGNLTGTSSTAGQLLFTLPAGFRPNGKAITFADNAAAATSVQVDALGQVQILQAGLTSVYLDGLMFSTL